MPDVTAVIPTHNRCGLLRRAVATALAQEHVDVQVVVVDDGSTDGTAAWLDVIRDDRVTAVRHERPLGVAVARNVGIERASGRYVAFLDDDDLWAPDKLAAQLDALAAHPNARWCIVGAAVVDPALRLQRFQQPPEDAHELVPRLLRSNCVPGGGSGVLVDRALADELRFDPDLSLLADWDFWIRCASSSSAATVPRPLVAYVRHRASMSSSLEAFGRELAHVQRKQADVSVAVGASIDWLAWLPWLAARHLAAGQLRPALASWSQAARLPGGRRVALRAIASAIAPALQARGRRHRALLRQGWQQELDCWLAPHRQKASGSRTPR